MLQAVSRGPVASIWQARQGLVIPRTYARGTDFEAVCADFAAAGWPVAIRHSGGGVVPQGPGVINVSLAWAVEGRPLDHADSAYGLLCSIMASALRSCGVTALPRAVDGSFCDGRFNLACIRDGQPQKIAGTAQLWRRQVMPDGEGYRQVVLAHGLLLIACDIDAITARANALEQALGHERRYLPERAVSMHTLMQAPPENDVLVNRVKDALRRELEQQDH